MEEILSRLIKSHVAMEKIQPFFYPRNFPVISHLLYADDIVIFSNSGKASMRAIMKDNEAWLGQIVNKAKSSVIFSNKIKLARHRVLLHLTGFIEGKLPSITWGFLLFMGDC